MCGSSAVDVEAGLGVFKGGNAIGCVGPGGAGGAGGVGGGVPTGVCGSCSCGLGGGVYPGVQGAGSGGVVGCRDGPNAESINSHRPLGTIAIKQLAPQYITHCAMPNQKRFWAAESDCVRARFGQRSIAVPHEFCERLLTTPAHTSSVSGC